MKRFLFMVAVAITLWAAACTPSSPDTTPGRQVIVNGQSYQVITVAQLKPMLENKDFLLVNVHIPYAGEINRTDLFIPYNQIEQNLAQLSEDKNARIVIYCRSGSMSGIAAKTLARLGYTDILDVEGGMAAWENAGYPIVQAPK